MKALVHTQPYQLEYTDCPDPTLGADDVLIRVKACGICGSDVQGYTGQTGRRIPPIIMGHEASGIIVGLGAGVTAFEPGDRVCFDSTVYCNKCGPCRSGQTNRCEQRQVLGVSVPGFRRHGAYAQRVGVPWWIVTKIPDQMTFVQASLLEPLSIGLHAANRLTPGGPDTVVIIGAGPIGLFILQAVRLKGATRIIVSDIEEYRLGVARQLGADRVINPAQEDLKGAVLEATDGRGAAAVFEAVGIPQTLQTAAGVTQAGGQVIAVGLRDRMVEIDMQEIISRELTLTGSYASAGEYREALDHLAAGRMVVDPLISEVLPLEQVELQGVLHRLEQQNLVHHLHLQYAEHCPRQSLSQFMSIHRTAECQW
ncbi:MAG: galactitol-1-phosphate 5-dehydrogenase [Candidatus Marinimicrobia bacterium]|nr:galactitol-1-phosphate 5-dehydrogenase [Candidatus Neomarinimicrobiota bacterium]